MSATEGAKAFRREVERHQVMRLARGGYLSRGLYKTRDEREEIVAGHEKRLANLNKVLGDKAPVR